MFALREEVFRVEIQNFIRKGKTSKNNKLSLKIGGQANRGGGEIRREEENEKEKGWRIREEKEGEREEEGMMERRKRGRCSSRKEEGEEGEVSRNRK